MGEAPATATMVGFARLAGCKRSYVTQLKRDDRLVFDDAGRILVDASRERIAATRDPSRIAVTQRHADARAQTAVTPSPAPSDAQGSAQAAPAASEPEPPPPESESLGFQHWRERNERAKALAGERDNAIAEGRLLDAVDVERVLASAIITLRSRLEALPDTLGPQLAALHDEDRARALLAGEIEHMLGECAREFSAASRRTETGH